MKKLILVAGAVLAANCAPAVDASAEAEQAAAATQPQKRTNPCDAEPYRAFDFWIGEWDVFGLDGKKGGENIISKEEYGCLLLEKWTDAQGGTGQSYNFYDPGLKKFRQVWVSIGATIDYAGGLNDAGEMVLEGDIHYQSGQTAPFRGTWTAQDDGSVKQHFVQYNAETKEWDEWFTGIYKRKASGGE